MDPLLFFALPLVVAFASASVSYYVMRCKHEVALAHQQAELAAAYTRIEALETDFPERLRSAAEAARRQAFEAFLADFRVEERRLIREDQSTARPLLVLRERLFFRHVPLSNWIEQEIPLQDGMELDTFNRLSAFCADALGSYVKPANAAAGAKLFIS